MEKNIPSALEEILATAARLFANQGKTLEVELLAGSTHSIEDTAYDNWDGGQYTYLISLHIPISLYLQIATEKDKLEKTILDTFCMLSKQFASEYIGSVVITPTLEAGEGWRERALAWVKGEGVTNQGRVRSDNIASRECDGLLFRSQPEIFFYKALKKTGISFSPLPVFIHGGAGYSRIEPDFVLVKEGITMVVEIDGDTVHRESPAEAHARTKILQDEGVHIERIKASACDSDAKASECVRNVLDTISKLKKANR